MSILGMGPQPIQEGSYGPIRVHTRQLRAITQRVHVSCSLNSLKGGYIGDYIGDYHKGY